MVCEPGSKALPSTTSPTASAGRTHLAVGQLGVRIVLAFDVGAQEPREGDDAAAGGELGLLALGHTFGHFGCQPDLRAGSAGVVHLGGHRALPDQLVQAELVSGQLAAGLVGRAEGLAEGRMPLRASCAFLTLRS